MEPEVSLKALTRQAVRELERSVILRTLQEHHWHRKRTAEALHISYRALLYKLKDCGFISGRSKPAQSKTEERP
ncbi:MAG: helix-turn-helix domain-containing protein [Terriglobales bacterium]